MAESQNKVALLEARLSALFDDPQFLSLNDKMSPLNMFEAVGATRGELRHSNFLAYLLSPSRPHRLGAKPLFAFLRSVLLRLDPSARPLMTLELIAGDLDDAIVYRERANIDILIDLPSLKLVVVIENKVGSKAGEGQLEKYRKVLDRDFPGYRRLLVFLTPDGSEPDEDSYVAYDYADLVGTLDEILASASEMPAETRLLIKHYIEMVRRYVVEDEALTNLAKTLYERHKEALDFLFDQRPEPFTLLTPVRNAVVGLDGLVEDSSTNNISRFLPERWDHELRVIKGDPNDWSKTGRGLLFEAKTYPSTPGRVNISLVLGPGDADTRKRVHELARADPATFSGDRLRDTVGDKWVALFSRDLLTKKQAQGMTEEARHTNVGLAWSEFQATQLPALTDAILEIDAKLADEGDAAAQSAKSQNPSTGSARRDSLAGGG